MSEFADRLIDWYRENKRELPWRETDDPYKIWISEIILQQTRVAQGYDYYVRFVQRFPDVFALAEADEDEVMKHWQGLGYYSRARNLHAAARSVKEAGAWRLYRCRHLFVCLRPAPCGSGRQCLSGAGPMDGHRYAHRFHTGQETLCTGGR